MSSKVSATAALKEATKSIRLAQAQIRKSDDMSGGGKKRKSKKGAGPKKTTKEIGRAHV